jgi:hypothetical protein
MATLESLLTAQPGDPDIPVLRQFLRQQMTDTRAALFQQDATLALWGTVPADNPERQQEEAKTRNTMAALLAKYNQLEARLNALPEPSATE